MIFMFLDSDDSPRSHRFIHGRLGCQELQEKQLTLCSRQVCSSRHIERVICAVLFYDSCPTATATEMDGKAVGIVDGLMDMLIIRSLFGRINAICEDVGLMVS